MDCERIVERARLDYGIGDFAATVRRCRSYRRFDEGDPVSREFMLACVDLARLSACAGNLQPLRYRVVSDAVERDRVFPELGWAAYYKEWDGPEPGERPTGYVALCCEGKPNPLAWLDAGIAAQTILLAAAEAGFGGCIVRNMKPGIQEALGLGEGVTALFVIALGVPLETVELEPLSASPCGLKYWRDENGVHHVPKRSLEDVLL